MYGVVVVRIDEQLHYLSACSGLMESNSYENDFGLAPKIPDPNEVNRLLSGVEAELDLLSSRIDILSKELESHDAPSLLANCERDFETARLQLKHIHKQRKALRASRRQCVASLSATASAELLDSLSRESQKDRTELKQLRRDWVAKSDEIAQPLHALEEDLNGLKTARRELSSQAQRSLFNCYRLKNIKGVERSITQLCDQQLPPSGSGDCAAPKLLQLCFNLGLTPLALAEFWWGLPDSQGVRHHKQFYPACRGKCGPILPFMLDGLCDPDSGTEIDFLSRTQIPLPKAVFEDEHLAVFEKPSGLLSIPGKQLQDSVQTRLQKIWPDATGPLLVHRLDMDTSGLLLTAKNLEIHKLLQKQFLSRTIVKHYHAILDGKPTDSINGDTASGTIKLPLRVDLDDRPRQCVCHEHGKSALTHWKLLECWLTGDGQWQSRVEFNPVTGRTHQLRLHAAHRDGLNSPIAGDPLYARTVLGHEREKSRDPSSTPPRMKLHASRLQFRHPVTDRPIDILSEVPF